MIEHNAPTLRFAPRQPMKFNAFRFLGAIVSMIGSVCCVQPAQAGYGQVPLFFIENRGQAGPDVRFMVKGPGISAFFARDEVSVAAGEGSLALRFQGANPTPEVEGIGPLPGKANFLVGPRSEWRTNLTTFGSVIYREIYPGIDLTYSASGEHIKSEFVVAPGADPSLIRLSYEIADRPHVEPDGVLILPTRSGQFRENTPVIYQDRDGRRET